MVSLASALVQILSEVAVQLLTVLVDCLPLENYLLVDSHLVEKKLVRYVTPQDVKLSVWFSTGLHDSTK